MACLAGLPQSVIDRANEVLAIHERSETAVSAELSPLPAARIEQQSIFDSSIEGIVEELSNLNVDDLRPLEALTLLHGWKERLKD